MSGITLERVDECRWRVPQMGNMRVPGIVYADTQMMDELGNEEALKGLARVCVKLDTEDCKPRSLWVDANRVRPVNKTPVGEYKAKAVP